MRLARAITGQGGPSPGTRERRPVPDRRFTVRLAVEADNDQLLDLTRRCPMSGGVPLLIERDPCFFTLSRLQGHPSLTAVAEDRAKNIVGCVSLALRHVYIDGQATPCFYGGDLKISPEIRNTTVLWQLHRFLENEVAPLGIDLEFTSVVEGNDQGEIVLRNLAGMPRYRTLGRIDVWTVPNRPVDAESDVSVETARAEDLPTLAGLLDQSNARYQFAPVWAEGTLRTAISNAPGLSVDAFHLARIDGELVGALAAWDQRQIQRVALTGAGGHEVRVVHLTHVAVPSEDPRVFGALVASVLRDWNDADAEFLVFGLAAGHPLSRALDRFSAESFPTWMYSVTPPGTRWEGYDFSRKALFHEVSHI